MRVVSDGKIVPPASAPLQKIRPMQVSPGCEQAPASIPMPSLSAALRQNGHKRGLPGGEAPQGEIACWLRCAIIAARGHRH